MGGDPDRLLYMTVSFPNFVDAILAYQQSYPNRTPLLSSADSANMGPLNEKLPEVLSTPKKMKSSIIYACIDEICKGSRKMEHIEHQIRTHCSGFSKEAPVGQGAATSYKNKYTIVTNVRVCRAILYCVRVLPAPTRTVWDSANLPAEASEDIRRGFNSPYIFILLSINHCFTRTHLSARVCSTQQPRSINITSTQPTIRTPCSHFQTCRQHGKTLTGGVWSVRLQRCRYLQHPRTRSIRGLFL